MSDTCAGCGRSGIDGDVCDWICEERASDRKKWQGKEPCTVCVEQDDPNDWQPATVGELCSMHEEQRNEAAHERSLEDYYGGSSPTLREQHEAARRMK